MVAIPGPSITPDRVLAAMHRPMPNIYEGPLVDVSHSVLADLPGIVKTDSEVFITIGNGHAGWQMAVNNTLSRGDKVLVLESGRFAIGWGEMAEQSGVIAEILPGSDDAPVSPEALEARLRADADHEIAAILVVLTDTATSVLNDIPALRAAIDRAGHPAMFMVDGIASIGCDVFDMDASGVDLTVAASQKGLMVPPGLAFVWAGPRALAARATADLVTSYFDWEPRRTPEAHYYLYAGTPPISHLFGLREALDMIAEEGGIDAVWARHEILARSVWAAIDAWSTPDGMRCNIADEASRSRATTTVITGSIDPDELRRVCEERAGLTIGLGIGSFEGRGIRIGHMGHLNPPMLLGTLGTIEAALHSMDAPMGGSGVAAAAAFLGGHLGEPDHLV